MSLISILPINSSSISAAIPLAASLASKVLGKGSQSSIGGFVMDVTISETHTKKSKATDNPLEEGFIASDHIDIEPDELTISAVVSQTPLNFGSSLQGLAASGAAIVGQQIGKGLGAGIGSTAAGAFIGLLKSSDNKILDAYNHLKDLRDKRVPFTVITGYERYDNMVLETLTINRDAKTGQALDFSATMKRLLIIKSKTITVPNVKKGVNGAGAKADLGKQHEQTPANNDTLALTLSKSLGLTK